MKPRAMLLIAMILGAAALRLVPHPSNFTPIGALALFAGAQFDEKRWAFIVPLAAMFLSDLVIGFHSGMPVVYLAFAAIVCMGFLLKEKKTALRVTTASFAAATPEELTELMRLTRDSEVALTEGYKPQGINVGVAIRY